MADQSDPPSRDFDRFRHGDGKSDLRAHDDHELMAELNDLGQVLGPFTGGILTDRMSMSEQLDFGTGSFRLAGRIRARVERRPLAPRNSDARDDGR